MKKVVYACCTCRTVADGEPSGRLEDPQMPQTWLAVRLEVGNVDRTIVDSGLEGQHACSTKCAASFLTKAAEIVVNDVPSLSVKVDDTAVAVTEH